MQVVADKNHPPAQVQGHRARARSACGCLKSRDSEQPQKRLNIAVAHQAEMNWVQKEKRRLRHPQYLKRILNHQTPRDHLGILVKRQALFRKEVLLAVGLLDAKRTLNAHQPQIIRTTQTFGRTTTSNDHCEAYALAMSISED